MVGGTLAMLRAAGVMYTSKLAVLKAALNTRTRASSEVRPLLYGSAITTVSVTEPALGTATMVYLLPRWVSKVWVPTVSTGALAVRTSQRCVPSPVSK